MSKQPSEATLLRQARSEIRQLEKELKEARSQAVTYRTRATKAETEASEWRTRFDILLRRDPPTQVTGPMSPIMPTITC